MTCAFKLDGNYPRAFNGEGDWEQQDGAKDVGQSGEQGFATGGTFTHTLVPETCLALVSRANEDVRFFDTTYVR